MHDSPPAGITILGATGSIGVNTLDVVSRYPDRFHVVALTANTDVEALAGQCQRFRPRYAVMADPDAAQRLTDRLRDTAADVRVLGGSDALMEVAGLPEVDCVMAAIVGAAGLLPSLEAARQGKRVLLANKEALVMSGALFMQAVRDNQAVLLPIDSEHNAILQCMPDNYVAGQAPRGVRKIMLTASGGPFRTLPIAELARVTPAQACAHPNWEMGRKISVDSATMMNKGLEVIEAGWLFDLPLEKIKVLIHPQSILHSMVEYDDGSVLAQLGNPDMRIPITHALAWPDRIDSGARQLDLTAVGSLQFEDPDKERFPCLGLACHAWEKGGTAPAILNAANEVAVQAFLDQQIAFTSIPRLIEHVMEHCTVHDAASLQAILEDDAAARCQARDYIGSGRMQASS
ncbi:MAG: 1-deoxy-D-xylulose-5-phosphate reductoisomerase [Gammaproteobacteria bacterium]|nr:1-deoxy-D-xylulose-5-phosphate reductoisomerase [Gammaproteobacteria bacterium]MDH3561266.1 1-deoxy-D-xylulose-5-phosphate reductoisomerase [Gammaproteobacteria bacterium]